MKLIGKCFWILCIFFTPILFCLDAQNISADKDLILALLAADTKEKQEDLMEAHKNLLTEAFTKMLYEEGERFRTIGEYEKALDAYDLQYRAAEKISYQEGMGRALDMSGFVLLNQDRFSEAREYLTRGLAIAEAINHKGLLGNVYGNLGLVYNQQSDFETALEYLYKSLEFRQALGEPIPIAISLTNIGKIHFAMAEYSLGLEETEKAKDIFEKANDQLKLSAALNNLARFYIELGNYSVALKHLQKSLELRQALNNKSGIATVYGNLGLIFRDHGDYDLALEHSNNALKIRIEIGEKISAFSTMHDIGTIYRGMGKFDQAIQMFQQTLQLREEIGDTEGVGESLNEMGEIYSDRGKLELATQCFNKSLKLQEEIQDKQGIAEALLNLGSTYTLQRKYEQSAEFIEKARVLLVQTGNLDLLRQAYASAGFLQYKQRRLPDALQNFEQAIALVEELRLEAVGGAEGQKSFLENKLTPYHGAAIVKMEQGNNQEALLYAERAKARVLVDVLQSGGVDVAGLTTQQERNEERKWKKQLETLNKQILSEKTKSQVDQAVLSNLNSKLHKIRLESEAYRAKLYSAHPALKSQRGETEPFNLQDVKELLRDGQTALLEYLITEEKTYGFVVTNSSTVFPIVRAFAVPIQRDELLAKINHFQKQIGSRGLLYREASRGLYNLLVAPAVAFLKKESNLVLIPDDFLWNLPFQVLTSPKENYLIEDFALSYVPSLTVLREMRKDRSKKASEKLLALGNPSIGKGSQELVKSLYRDTTLNPLPEAEREVKMLSELYGTDHSQIYVGAEAREERIKSESQNFQIIHLATHGIIDNTSPLYSHLLLSQSSSDEDGLLEAREIMNLNLNANLAVLSACETARGKVSGGEGVIGLSWAFFVAGVPTTVVSQWKVDSASTTGLMLEFHRNLTQKKLPPAKALQHAELKLLRTGQFSHPFYWSAFVVVGNGFSSN